MKASLDTNAIIHFYKAGLEDIIFSMFPDGIIIYEQIRNTELVGTSWSRSFKSGRCGHFDSEIFNW